MAKPSPVKKSAKKEAPAAKAKKAEVKPVAKAVAKPAAKAAPKAVEKPAPKAAPAKVAKPVAKETPKKEAPVKALKAEKPAKEAKIQPQEVETAEEAAPVVAKAKKGKKVKLDKNGLSEDQAKWQEMHEKHKGDKAPNYSIGGQFEAKKPLIHKLFGWGYVLSNEYDRLEVIFEDAKRMLISNRKL